MFYFEAQTGILRDKPPTFSNFYNYRLPASARVRVEGAVDEAHVSAGGLEYPAKFVLWLTDKELKQ